MSRFVDAHPSERCQAVIRLRDGAPADCGRKGTGTPRRCWQHKPDPNNCPECGEFLYEPHAPGCPADAETNPNTR